MDTLSNVAIMLSMNPDKLDDAISEKLEVIIDLTEARLKALLSSDEIPNELAYIVSEVAIKRYNRIGSEGGNSHSVEGESWSWTDSDFDEFKDDISEYRKAHEGKGVLRFI